VSGPLAGRDSAAKLLLRDKSELARAVTARLYAEHPDLLERHGERGCEKCLQDISHTVEHLIPAVELEDAPMFATYVSWLDALLRARGVATRDVRRSLDLLADEAGARYPGSHGPLIQRILNAGVAVLVAE
jgi:hypothetical protein